MAWVEHAYPGEERLALAVADALQEACEQGLRARGKAWLALAGGRTPLPAYRLLAARQMSWPDIAAVPTDERCVPHDHPACNLRQIRSAVVLAARMPLVALTPADGDPRHAAAHAARALEACPGPFDAVVLGMGEDGHTASLFPGAPGLAQALALDGVDDVARIDPDPLPPEAPFPRITLTAPRLLRANALHLVVTGEAKRAVLDQAQSQGDARLHPIAALLHAPGACVHIHWTA